MDSFTTDGANGRETISARWLPAADVHDSDYGVPSVEAAV